jgi:hypothetical protein
MRLLLVATGSFCAAQFAYSGPLTEAKVNKIVNEVAVVDPQTGSRPAALNEVIT